MANSTNGGFPAERALAMWSHDVINVGDWVHLTRTIDMHRTVVDTPYRMKRIEYSLSQLLRAYVELTPLEAKVNPVAIRNRAPLFHLSQVHLLEQNGEYMYEPQPNLLLDPMKQDFTIERVTPAIPTELFVPEQFALARTVALH